MQSREAIKLAFQKLLASNSLDSIKVSDICNEACVSRRAFYNIFSSKYEVIEQILEDDLIKPVQVLNSLFGIGTLKTSPLLLAERVYLKVYENKSFYTNLVTHKSVHYGFVDMVTKQYQTLNNELFAKTDVSKEEREFISYLVAAAQAMVFQRWIREGMKTPPQVMAKYFSKYVLAAVSPESMTLLTEDEPAA